MKKQPIGNIANIEKLDLMNKVHLSALQAAIQAALNNIHPSIKITLTGGQFSTDGLKGKYEVTSAGGPSMRESRMAKDLELQAQFSGLDVAKVGPKGERLVGFNSKGRSQPWIISKPDGQRYKISDEWAERMFKKEGA
jgi:hypothetical protein